MILLDNKNNQSQGKKKGSHVLAAIIPLITVLAIMGGAIYVVKDMGFGDKDDDDFDPRYIVDPDGNKVPLDDVINDWFLKQDIAPREDITGISIDDQKSLIEDQSYSEMNFTGSAIYEGLELVREDGGEIQDMIVHITIRKKIGRESISVPVRQYVDDIFADESGEMDSEDIYSIKHGWQGVLTGREYYYDLISSEVPVAQRNSYPDYDTVMSNYNKLESEIDGYPDRDEPAGWKLWADINWHRDVSPISNGTGEVPFRDENNNPVYQNVTLYMIAYENPNIQKTSGMTEKDHLYDFFDDNRVVHSLSTYNDGSEFAFIYPTTSIPYDFTNSGFYYGSCLDYVDIAAISDLKTVVWFEGDDLKDPEEGTLEHPGLGFWQERPMADLHAYEDLYGNVGEVVIQQRLIIPRAADTTLKGIQIQIQREYDWAIYTGEHNGRNYTAFKRPVRETTSETDYFTIDFPWEDDAYTLSIEKLEEWNFWHGGAPIVEISYSEGEGSMLGMVGDNPAFTLKVQGTQRTDFILRELSESVAWSHQVPDDKQKDDKGFDQVWGTFMKNDTMTFTVIGIALTFAIVASVKIKKGRRK